MALTNILVKKVIPITYNTYHLNDKINVSWNF